MIIAIYVFSSQDKMIIYGGITNNGVNNEFLSFDISSDTWNVVTVS